MLSRRIDTTAVAAARACAQLHHYGAGMQLGPRAQSAPRSVSVQAAADGAASSTNQAWVATCDASRILPVQLLPHAGSKHSLASKKGRLVKGLKTESNSDQREHCNDGQSTNNLCFSSWVVRARLRRL